MNCRNRRLILQPCLWEALIHFLVWCDGINVKSVLWCRFVHILVTKMIHCSYKSSVDILFFNIMTPTACVSRQIACSSFYHIVRRNLYHRMQKQKYLKTLDVYIGMIYLLWRVLETWVQTLSLSFICRTRQNLMWQKLKECQLLSSSRFDLRWWNRNWCMTLLTWTCHLCLGKARLILSNVICNQHQFNSDSLTFYSVLSSSN